MGDAYSGEWVGCNEGEEEYEGSLRVDHKASTAQQHSKPRSIVDMYDGFVAPSDPIQFDGRR
jgi:hypothetical protein